MMGKWAKPSGVAAAIRRLCTAAGATATAAESKLLYRRLSALGKAQEGSVAKTVEAWIREGRSVTVDELLKFSRELRRYKRYDHALELIEWMEKKGMRMSNGTFAIRLDLIFKANGMDSAESYFYSLPPSAQNQHTYCALLSNYCQAEREDKAITLYEKMKDLNFISETLVQNNILTLYLKLGRPEKVLNIFEEMKAMDIPPDSYTYSIVVRAHGMLSDIDAAERLFHEAQLLGGRYAVFLNWTFYGSLSAMYTSAGLVDKAKFALKKLEQVMGKSGRIPFHHLISLYAGIGDLGEVHRVWKSLKSTFPSTINASYLIMLRALSKLDDINALMQLFQEWESGCSSYDTRLLNTVIDAYLRKDKISEAENLWEKAKERGFGADFRTFDYFIDYYLKSDINVALKCLENATATALVKNDGRWKPNKRQADAFLNQFEETKDADGAEAVFKCLEKLDCVPAEAHERLLRIYHAAGRRKTLASLDERIKLDVVKLSP